MKETKNASKKNKIITLICVLLIVWFIIINWDTQLFGHALWAALKSIF